jgi:hypothetical protein
MRNMIRLLLVPFAVPTFLLVAAPAGAQNDGADGSGSGGEPACAATDLLGACGTDGLTTGTITNSPRVPGTSAAPSGTSAAPSGTSAAPSGPGRAANGGNINAGPGDGGEGADGEHGDMDPGKSGKNNAPDSPPGRAKR